MKRVAIAAGGNRGHFYPGLVVAQTLRARGWEPLMIVRAGDPALAALEKEGLASLPVDLRGLPRRPGPELFTFARKLAGSMGTLSRALRSFQPDLALGMGGYLTFPLLFAARVAAGIPRAVHESSAVCSASRERRRRQVRRRSFLGTSPGRSLYRAGSLVGTPVRPALVGPPRAPLESAPRAGARPWTADPPRIRRKPRRASPSTAALPAALSAPLPDGLQSPAPRRQGQGRSRRRRLPRGGREGRRARVSRGHGQRLRRDRPRALPLRGEHFLAGLAAQRARPRSSCPTPTRRPATKT